MKDLREILEASILDIEDTLNTDINFELLLSASSIEQFNSYCNALKDVIEYSGMDHLIINNLRKENLMCLFSEIIGLMIVKL